MTAKDLYALASYQYELPEELIAQYPLIPRDSSRLMIVDRSTGQISELVFRDLVDFLNQGDSFVFNDTRVIPARLKGKKRTGGDVEIFLTRRHGDGTWDALVKPGKRLQPGASVVFNPAFSCEVLELLADGGRRVRFHCQGDLETLLEECGHIPLPHYIRRPPDVDDKERYQTIYASKPGAIAAPTAGLHFSEEMLRQFDSKGITQTRITLHVGLSTFRPVQSEDIRTHYMHVERCIITEEAARHLNECPSGNRMICVGTTSCRALEAAANREGIIQPGDFDTNIFIYPGYSFKCVNALLTNFHLPASTLLMLVCAFAGYDLTMEAYAKAIKERFRFYSYGDAMLIL
jgi:S-adenosylmethionine:tRNA ribosyltransferase-isomerase